MECIKCKKKTKNEELIVNNKKELVLTPICEECYNAFVTSEKV